MNALDEKRIAEISPIICEKYRQGYKVKELAQEMGVSVAFVYKVLHTNDVEIKPQGPQKLTNQHQLILEKYRQKISTVKIAALLGVSRQAVCDVLAKHDIDRDKCVKMRPNKYQKVIALHEQGLTVDMIAKKFEVSPDTIRRVLKDPAIYPNYKPLTRKTSANTKHKKRNVISKENYAVIISRIAAGENKSDLAKEYNVSKMTIYNIIKRTDKLSELNIVETKEIKEECNAK